MAKLILKIQLSVVFWAQYSLVRHDCDTQDAVSFWVGPAAGSLATGLRRRLRPGHTVAGCWENKNPRAIDRAGVERSKLVVRSKATPSRAWQADPPDPGRAVGHGRRVRRCGRDRRRSRVLLGVIGPRAASPSAPTLNDRRASVKRPATRVLHIIYRITRNPLSLVSAK